MEVQIGRTSSKKNTINKSFSISNSLQCRLKEECSVMNPILLLTIDNPSNLNYLYIPEFHRYYFITDWVSIRNNLWECHAAVDVLHSFASDILSLDVVLDHSQATGTDKYLPSERWMARCKTFTEIKQFPSGLQASGEYILIASGG